MYFSFGKIVRIICVATIMAVVYIYMQMTIIDLGYKQRMKQKNISKLREQNNYTAYTIARLKSANYLGRVMLTEGSNMQFVDCDRVFRVAVYSPSVNDRNIHTTANIRKDRSLFSGLLSLVSQAEAMAEE